MIDSASTHANALISTTITAAKALSATSITSSNALVAQGQTEVITFNWANGVSTYVSNIIVTNALNGNIIANVINAGLATTSNVLVFVVPSTNDAQEHSTL